MDFESHINKPNKLNHSAPAITARLAYPSWLEAAAALKAQNLGFVLVTVLDVTGSAPRDAGTKMLVSSQGIADTIGGGHLEYLAISHAQALLRQPLCNDNNQSSSNDNKQSLNRKNQIEHYPLGARLGQCCGGRVTLLYECFLTTQTPVFIFGAGHVGQALISILAKLPLAITWVDTRQNEFPERIPTGVKTVVSQAPHEELMDVPAGGFVVVMTHNHTQDFDIVRTALARDDLAYVGVIGSQTKANRFRNRLEHRGISTEKRAFLRCPIGLDAVPGKHPMEVAVSVAGELIARYHEIHNRSQDQSQGQSVAQPASAHIAQDVSPSNNLTSKPTLTPA